MNGDIPSQINDRPVIFGAVTGSYNYNLNEEGSDKDWHFLVLPSFEDVYTGRLYTDAQVTTVLDYTAWDIRKFSEQLWKSNPNVLEMLFSIDERFPDPEYENEMKIILALKDSLVKMNLPYLYKAGMGIVHNEIKEMDRRNPDLLQEFGYNTKMAMHAYRTLRTLKEFGENGFTDFGDVLHCDSDKRKELLEVKHGEKFKDIDDARYQLSCYKEQVAKDWEHAYLSAKPDDDVRLTLNHVCKSMFRKSLKKL
jgi:predicted nucleotidyltransferase